MNKNTRQSATKRSDKGIDREVDIFAGPVMLSGELVIPAGAVGVVLFAHGSGSSRHSPRNQFIAEKIRERGTGTCLFDLLTCDEEIADAVNGHLGFDIPFLAQRLIDATRWLANQPAAEHLGIGYFGASTGGAAALVAAAELGPVVDAVVSRGGRPDLAGNALPRVEPPTLLIVGGLDDMVLQWNQQAYQRLSSEKEFKVVPGATHLFEEPGTLEKVASLAGAWFRKYLKPR